MRTKPIRALIADDDITNCQFLKDLLEINFENIQVDKALSTGVFFEKVNHPLNTYNLIFLDYYLDSESGADVIAEINRHSPQILPQTVLLNGTSDDYASDARVHDIAALRKPLSLDHFEEILRDKICG